VRFAFQLRLPIIGYIGLFCVSLSQTWPNQAYAFDCAAARSKSEKAICSATDAKAADDAMNDAFSRFKATSEAVTAKALLANQRDWLKTRNSTCTADAGCFRLADQARVRTLTGQPEAGPGTTSRLTPVFVERPGSKATYSVSLLLYRFADAKSAGEKLFNAATDAIIKEAPVKTDDTSGTFSYSYDRKSEIAYGSDRLLSIATSAFDFTGGAHGQSNIAVLNLDLSVGRELKMADFLDKKALDSLTTTCKSQISGQLKDRLKGEGLDLDPDTLKTASDGVASTMAELTVWRFGNATVTVLFGEDTVAAHAIGAFTCDIPYTQLRPLVRSGFPLP
jgi:uncharacterized protein